VAATYQSDTSQQQLRIKRRAKKKIVGHSEQRLPIGGE
jgi:hypothetical protein